MDRQEANKLGYKVVEQFEKVGIHATAEAVLDTIAYIGSFVSEDEYQDLPEEIKVYMGAGEYVKWKEKETDTEIAKRVILKYLEEVAPMEGSAGHDGAYSILNWLDKED